MFARLNDAAFNILAQTLYDVLPAKGHERALRYIAQRKQPNWDGFILDSIYAEKVQGGPGHYDYTVLNLPASLLDPEAPEREVNAFGRNFNLCILDIPPTIKLVAALKRAHDTLFTLVPGAVPEDWCNYLGGLVSYDTRTIERVAGKPGALQLILACATGWCRGPAGLHQLHLGLYTPSSYQAVSLIGEPAQIWCTVNGISAAEMAQGAPRIVKMFAAKQRPVRIIYDARQDENEAALTQEWTTAFPALSFINLTL